MVADQHHNRAAQEQTEQRHIGAFLAAAGIRADLVEYRDRPDAVLVVAGRRIGLEHRELTEEDLAGNQRNLVLLEKCIVEEMKRLGVPGDILVAVSVDATADYFRKRRQVEALARNIAASATAKASEVTVGSPVRLPASHVAPLGALGADLLVVERHAHLREGALRHRFARVLGAGGLDRLGSHRRKSGEARNLPRGAELGRGLAPPRYGRVVGPGHRLGAPR